jgi:hypothetical protein
MTHDEMTPHGESTYHCYFRKQPTSPQELDQAISAMAVSCVEALRYAGDDPAMLKRLEDTGMRHRCDKLTGDNALPGVWFPPYRPPQEQKRWWQFWK